MISYYEGLEVSARAASNPTNNKRSKGVRSLETPQLAVILSGEHINTHIDLVAYYDVFSLTGECVARYWLTYDIPYYYTGEYVMWFNDKEVELL